MINGDLTGQINATDRALQYGDGLFETIVIRDGKVQLWKQHIQRLEKGCQRLAINNVNYAQLTDEAMLLCNNQSNAILKIIISRGINGRGYRFNKSDKDSVATRLLSIYPFPKHPENHYKEGIALRLCQMKMGRNPVLAGIKHLNRLEQVMARNEWQDENVFEGLMCDEMSNIIEGTMSNYFMIKNKRLVTADISHSGVAGIVRQLIVDDEIDHQLPVEITSISEQQLHSADEVFICNSVIGIMPVKSFTKQSYAIGSVTKHLVNKLTDYCKHAANYGFN